MASNKKLVVSRKLASKQSEDLVNHVTDIINKIGPIPLEDEWGNHIEPIIEPTVVEPKVNNESEDKGKFKARGRSYCFTINNPTGSKEEWLEFFKTQKAKYIVLGDEVAPTTGTPHIQGYVDFVNPRTWGGVIKLLKGLAHVEPRKGTFQQAADYCKEDNKFVEWGTPPRQGARGDIENVKECVLEGMTMNEMINEDFINNNQQLRFAEGLMKYKEKRRDPANPPLILWFWGPTGTGKTRTAMELYPDAWLSGRNLKWWPGYDGHKHVIIDDFRGDFCTFHELLRITDRYPFSVECKGGSRELLAEVIIITCPQRPEEVYIKSDEEILQLTRRISEIRDFRTKIPITTLSTTNEPIVH